MTGLTNQACAFIIYMDRMSRMPERFKTMKDAAENWPTVSQKVRDYYDELVMFYLDQQREYSVMKGDENE